jgi:hypothetical protein
MLRGTNEQALQKNTMPNSKDHGSRYVVVHAHDVCISNVSSMKVPIIRTGEDEKRQMRRVNALRLK